VQEIAGKRILVVGASSGIGRAVGVHAARHGANVAFSARRETLLAEAVDAACVHGGQGCAITSRLLLPRARYEEGVEIARAALASMPYGDPTDPTVIMGPLVSAAQRERVEG